MWGGYKGYPPLPTWEHALTTFQLLSTWLFETSGKLLKVGFYLLFIYIFPWLQPYNMVNAYFYGGCPITTRFEPII